jgi:pentatricopeptide repeat protein
LGSLDKAKQIHAEFNDTTTTTTTTTTSTQMYNSLTNMYSKCGSVEDARNLFDELREKGQADIVTWNTMLHAYLTNNNPTETVKLFIELQQQQQQQDNNDNTLRCTSVTYGTVLTACAAIGKEALNVGEGLHREFISWESLKKDAVLSTALMNMYGRCGKVGEALKLFDRLLPNHGRTSTPFWTTALHFFLEGQQHQEAQQLLHKMLLTEGDKDKFLTTKQIKEDAILLSVALKVCKAAGDKELSKHLQEEINSYLFI